MFAEVFGYRVRTFPLYQEVTARDLLQRRVTATEGDSPPLAPHESHPVGSNVAALSAVGNNTHNTTWVDSPLIAAARNGDLCVLDGIDR